MIEMVLCSKNSSAKSVAVISNDLLAEVDSMLV